MTTKQLKELLDQIEALKTADTSAQFQGGVDAAKSVLSTVVQASLDRERMQKLETELAELRAKYAVDGQAEPKRRGRKPKQSTTPSPEFETVSGA